MESARRKGGELEQDGRVSLRELDARKEKHEGKSGCERPLSINYPPTLSLTAGTSGFSRKLNQNRSPLEPGLNIGPSENPRRENMETAFAERLQELAALMALGTGKGEGVVKEEEQQQSCKMSRI